MTIDPKQVADADQAAAWMTDALPRLWFSMYLGLRREGFTEVQAFELVKTYVMTSCRNQPG